MPHHTLRDLFPTEEEKKQRAQGGLLSQLFPDPFEPPGPERGLLTRIARAGTAGLGQAGNVLLGFAEKAGDVAGRQFEKIPGVTQAQDVLSLGGRLPASERDVVGDVEERGAAIAEIQAEQPIAGFAGELVGTLAQIGLTPSSAAFLGRIGLSPRVAFAVSSIARSIPTSLMQSIGSREFGSGVQGAARLSRMFGGEKGQQIADALEPILADPTKRAIADGIFDAILGFAFEAVAGGVKALRNVDLARADTDDFTRLALPSPQKQLPPAREVPVGERLRPEGAGPIEAGPIRGGIPQGPTPIIGPERQLAPDTRRPGQRLAERAGAAARGRAEAVRPGLLGRLFPTRTAETLPEGAPEVLGGTRGQLLGREAQEGAIARQELSQAQAEARTAAEGPRVARGVQTAPIEQQLQPGRVGISVVRIKGTDILEEGVPHPVARGNLTGKVRRGDFEDRGIPRDAILTRETDPPATRNGRPVVRIEDGFLDEISGNFISRQRASDLGLRTGQLERGPLREEGIAFSEELTELPRGAQTAAEVLQGLDTPDDALRMVRNVISDGDLATEDIPDIARALRAAGQEDLARRVGAVNSPIKKVDEAVIEAHKSGGSTFNPHTGENIVGRDTWAVSGFKEREHVITRRAPTAQDIADFRVANKDLFDASGPKGELKIGTWFDEKTNRHVLDVVSTTDDKLKALRFAKENDQDAIINLKTFEEIRLADVEIDKFGQITFKKGPEAGVAGREVLQSVTGAGLGAAVGGAVGGEEGALAGLVVGAAAGNPRAVKRLTSQLGEAGAIQLKGDDPALRVAVELFRTGNPLSDAKFKRIAKKIGVAPDQRTLDRARQLWFQLSTTTVDGMKSLKELDKFAKQGLAGAPWYDDVLEAVTREFGEADGKMFLRFFAVTSQNTKFLVDPKKADNLTLALKAFREWKEGKPFGSRFHYTVAHKEIVQNLKRVAAGQRPGSAPGKAPKLNDFMDALLGDVNAVVVDRWMMRAFGFQGKSPGKAQRLFIQRLIREDAARWGLTPRQYQAAIWRGSLDKAGQLKLPKGVTVGSPSEAMARRIKRAGGFAEWLSGEGGQVGREVLQALAGAGVGAVVGAPLGERAGVGAPAGAVAGALAGAGLTRRARARTAPGAGGPGPVPFAERVVREPSAKGFRRATDTLGKEGRKTRVQFNKFGLDRPTQNAIEAEAQRLVQTGEITLRKVTHAETLREARKLGFEKVTSRPTDSVTLTATRSLINRNSDNLLQLHKRLEELNTTGGRIREVESLEVQIASLENQNIELVKIFQQGASETARALSSLRIQATRSLGPESAPYWRNKLHRIARRGLTAEETASLDRALKRQDINEIMKIADRLAPPKGLGETLLAMRRAGLLTGVRTQIRNAASNLSEAIMRQADEPTAVAADAIFSSITGRTRSRIAVRPTERLAASLKGSRRGIGLMGEILSGKRILDPGEARKFEMTESMLRNNLFLDGYIKWIHRAQGAVDKPWKMAAMMESLVEQAKWMKKFGGSAEPEQLLVARALKSFDTGVPNDMALQAIVDAEIATFQNSSVIGRILARTGETLKAEAVQGRTGAGAVSAAFEFIIPFKNTPGAVLGRLVERTGIGAISGVRDLLRLAKRTDLSDEAFRAIQRQATGRIGRGTTGVFAIWLGYQLGAQKLLSGAWPGTSKERQLWQQEGKTSDAIRIGGRWRKLNGISPIGNLLAIGANMYHTFNDPEMTPTDAAINFGQTTGATFIDQSFMRGVQDFNRFFDPRQGGLTGRAVQSAATSWIPIAVQDFARAIDKTEREVRNIPDAVKAKTPFFSVQVPARISRTGQPIKQTALGRAGQLISPGFTPTPEPQTPGLVEANKVGAVIPPVGRRSREEPQEETRERQTVIGQDRDKAIVVMRDLPQYRKLTRDQKREAIEDLMRDVSREISTRAKKRKEGIKAMPQGRLRLLAVRAIRRARER